MAAGGWRAAVVTLVLSVCAAAQPVSDGTDPHARDSGGGVLYVRLKPCPPEGDGHAPDEMNAWLTAWLARARAAQVAATSEAADTPALGFLARDGRTGLADLGQTAVAVPDTDYDEPLARMREALWHSTALVVDMLRTAAWQMRRAAERLGALDEDSTSLTAAVR